MNSAMQILLRAKNSDFQSRQTAQTSSHDELIGPGAPSIRNQQQVTIQRALALLEEPLKLDYLSPLLLNQVSNAQREIRFSMST